MLHSRFKHNTSKIQYNIATCPNLSHVPFLGPPLFWPQDIFPIPKTNLCLTEMWATCEVKFSSSHMKEKKKNKKKVKLMSFI